MSDPTPDSVPSAKNGEKGRRSKKNRRDSARPPSYARHTQFTGRTEGLEDAIYDIGISNQADMFMQTTKKIANYAGRTLKESQDTRLAIENVEDVDVPRPVLKIAAKAKKDPEDKDSASEDEFNKLIYLKEIDTYVKSLDE